MAETRAQLGGARAVEPWARQLDAAGTRRVDAALTTHPWHRTNRPFRSPTRDAATENGQKVLYTSTTSRHTLLWNQTAPTTLRGFRTRSAGCEEGEFCEETDGHIGHHRGDPVHRRECDRVCQRGGCVQERRKRLERRSVHHDGRGCQEQHSCRNDRTGHGLGGPRCHRAGAGQVVLADGLVISDWSE